MIINRSGYRQGEEVLNGKAKKKREHNGFVARMHSYGYIFSWELPKLHYEWRQCGWVGHRVSATIQKRGNKGTMI